MSCLIPKSDDNKLPTSSKKGWKHLRRIFKSFKNSDDYYNHYYQYHVHYDDYKKQQRRGSGATKSSTVEAPMVHHQAVAARALTSSRERAHVHRRSKNEPRDRNALGDNVENGEGVDADCEKFIEWFRDGWKLERQISAEEFRDMLDRSA